jgi:hypothetical protein
MSDPRRILIVDDEPETLALDPKSAPASAAVPRRSTWATWPSPIILTNTQVITNPEPSPGPRRPDTIQFDTTRHDTKRRPTLALATFAIGMAMFVLLFALVAACDRL